MLTIGRNHSCGVAEGGVGYCWGFHGYGELGIGKLEGRCEIEGRLHCSNTPAEIVGGHRFRTLAAGFFHTCGVTEDYELYCWGLNTNAQFSSDSGEVCGDILYGEVSCSSVPVLIPGAPPLDTLIASGAHTCGLTPDGEAYCWGHNGVGELGDGNQPKNSPVPVPVAGGHRFVMLTPFCGLTAAGEVYCWGLAEGGAGYATEDCQHGRDLVRCNPVPVPVQGGVRFRSISSNSSHVCGISLDGLPYCWGTNEHGELGNGDQLERRYGSTPVWVPGTK
jgi:alpha-tubulin suppressor-like RCC1 family protein